MSSDLSEKLGRYLSKHFDAVQIDALARIHGGASRETYRFEMRFQDKGTPSARHLILRRAPEGSLIDTDARTEYAAFKAFWGQGVPVPEPLFLEEDAAPLDRPFFIMEEIQDSQCAIPFSPDPYGEHAEKIGKDFWEILGAIASGDPQSLGLTKAMDRPQPEECWRRELDYWEGVINEDETEPQPIARAAIRKLRRNPPPPPQKITPIHGDYRTGNFLFNNKGDITAILDWEMAHLGDPLEDVAWALDELWTSSDPNKAGSMIENRRALEIWQKKSGIAINAEALRWWRIFAALKGVAIWISSAKEFQDGVNHDPILCLSGWYILAKHNQILLNLSQRAFCRRCALMAPEVGDILRASFLQMLTQIAPQMKNDYDARSVSLLGTILMLCAEEYERAADIRVKENDAMRALFLKAQLLKAQRLMGDARLAEEIARAAKRKEQSLEISELNQVNHDLKRALIRLQSFCEEEKAPWAEEMEKEIDACLQLIAKGRIIELPPM